MGGYGSGSHKYNKETVEDGKKLHIKVITRTPDFKRLISGETNFIVGGITWTNSYTKEQAGSIGYTARKIEELILIDLEYTYSNTWSGFKEKMEYPVMLIPLQRKGRGSIYLFECPLCRQHRGFKLYSSGSKYFACRKCLNLNYQSSKDSRRYDRLFDLIAKDTGIDPKQVKQILKDEKISNLYL